VGLPAVVKTAGWGYDGKGQVKIGSAAEAAAAWTALGTDEAVVEAWIDFERELSVVAARGLSGAYADYGLIENRHQNHILDLSIARPAPPPDVLRQAREIARGVLDALGVVGVLCVELFLTRDGRLLVNELAPRPHNSGHLTFDAPSPASSSSSCARSAACRSAPPTSCGRRPWPTSWATSGRRASPTGPPPAARRPSSSTSTARPPPARAARWAI